MCAFIVPVLFFYCHEDVDVCLYSTYAFFDCREDVDVCIYNTCAFLIVMKMLMQIMYSASSS